MSNRRRTRPRLVKKPGGLPPGAEVRSATITNEAGEDVSHLFGIAPADRGPVNGSLGPLRLAPPEPAPYNVIQRASFTDESY